MVERVTFLGDTTGMKPEDIRTFVKITGHLYGGSYPSLGDLPKESIVYKTQDLLTRAGIIDPSPIVPCGSIKKRAEQIIQNCNRRRMQIGLGLYWVIDSDPIALVEAIKSTADSKDPLQSEILNSITMIRLGSMQGFDHSDPTTGIRIVSLPCTLSCFPTHPTPNS